MSILKLRREDGSWAEITAIVGSNGKSAYEYAKEGAYTGTEAEFAAQMAKEIYSKSEADEKIQEMLGFAKQYTNSEIAALINGAPTTLDTLGEIATAMAENADVVAALDGAIGSKAAAADLSAHTGNKSNPHGVTASQIGLSTENWTFTLADGSTVTKVVYIG